MNASGAPADLLHADSPRAGRRRRGEIIALLAMALAFAFQTLLPPPVGLADNGDFARLAGPWGLASPIHDRYGHYFNFLVPGFGIGPPYWASGYGTSESIPVVLARAIGKVFSKTGFLDMRVIGAVNALFVLAASAVLLAAIRPWNRVARSLFTVMLVGVYTDVAYVAAFNSLYSQTATLWTFLFLAGFVILASGRPTAFALCGYWLAALAFVTAKPQEIVQAPFLALLGVFLMEGRRGEEGKGRRGSALALGAALCVVAVVYFLRIPKLISGPGLHNEVFVEILGHSADPARDLRELGLPAGWSIYAGLNPHDPRSPYSQEEFHREFFRNVGPGRLFVFWAGHPRRAAGLFRRCLRRSLEMRPPELGNFRQSDDPFPLRKSRAFAVWSAMKTGLARHSLLLIALILLGAGSGGALLATRGTGPPARRLGVALILLPVMAGIELVVPVFAQGGWGIERVLFGFHAMLDFCIIAEAVLAASLFAPRPEKPATET